MEGNYYLIFKEVFVGWKILFRIWVKNVYLI